MRALLLFLVLALAALPAPPAAAQSVRHFDVPAGAGPHDVAPAPDGTVWYTAQRAGALGRLDPASGRIEQVPLGEGSAPHGVIVGPDGAAWVTDGGLDAIVRVDPATLEVRRFALPAGTPRANLNTAAFDGRGVLWFTGQSGWYGSVDPRSGKVTAKPAPGGRGPYGIAATPAGEVWYVSLAGSHLARIDPASGEAAVVVPPTPGQGARRVWSDSKGRLWISEWSSGQVSAYDPAARRWRQWTPPGSKGGGGMYAVYVDERDDVWLADWSADAIWRFDPRTERFARIEGVGGNGVRQLLGRAGEVWGAESGRDRLFVIDTRR